jgi:hypothetical protein
LPTITNGLGLRVSLRAKSRRNFLVNAVGELTCETLEIGALDNPTFLPNEGDAFFADYFTQEESINRHRNGLAHSWEKIVPVDYVLRDRHIGDAAPVGLVIANHVIEHLPDPIRWFQEIAKISGRLFLSIPDRRYTFDYFKPVTDAVDWLRCYDERLTTPSRYHILRHLYYHAGLKASEAWEGNLPDDHLHRIPMPAAIDKAEALSARYADVHCSVFTFESFQRIIADLDETGLVPWRIASVEDVRPNENEFRVLLERR